MAIQKTLALVLFLLGSLTGFGQTDYLARLTLLGSASELGVSPTEKIWVATKAGNVYYTPQVGELWNIGPFGSLDPYAYSTGQTFERVNFFSEDTLMISGFIQEDGKQDFVYWSGDGGKSREKVRFGKSSWIDAAYINTRGKAWMSGNSQLIYYTEDYGKSWREFDKIEQKGNLRFSTIYFAKDEKTGLFGSFWNVLYRTTDNCRSWERLPTPLMQNKYERLSKNDRPDIRKIRMFGNFYIINQQGRVFITKSDSLDWTYLPQVIDFEVSESEKLYTINSDYTTELFDPLFSSIWKSGKMLEQIPSAIAVRNESLFALTDRKIYKINPGQFQESDLMTSQVAISEPYLKVEHNNELWGFENRDVLRFDKKRGQWHRLMSLDFQIGNATAFGGHLLVADASLQHYYQLNTTQKTAEKFELPKSLFDLKNNRVTELHFERGSQGCFHTENARRSYTRKNNTFTLDRKTANSKYLSKTSKEIESAFVDQLVAILDQSRYERVTVSDLNFTEKDVANFKTFIEKEEQKIKKSGIDRSDYYNLYAFPGENTDFNFYKNVADSVFSLPSQSINNAFWQAYGSWSTTTEWSRVVFVFKDGRKLLVENSDDKPNYLYTPWVVDYDGLRFKTNSIKFGELIDQLTRTEFFDATTRDKNYALFKIADYLYKAKLSKEDTMQR